MFGVYITEHLQQGFLTAVYIKNNHADFILKRSLYQTRVLIGL